VANQLGIQVRSAWRYFDASARADSLAQSLREFEDSSPDEAVNAAVNAWTAGHLHGEDG
jgi:hypothetical protein